MFDFFPEEIQVALSVVNTDELFGIRLRTGFPIVVYSNNKDGFLCKNGVFYDKKDAIICHEKHIDYILKKVTAHSLYAFNEQIKNGFLTTEKGVRIGLAGECVFDNGKIVTIKNITSMNIRVPHFIKGCSKNLLPHIFRKDEFFNTLIVSPPFSGKTTLLKDIAMFLNKYSDKSILIIDERGEFSEVAGANIDKIKYSDKLYAFNYGIRSLSPNIVITDELVSESDGECIKSAKNSGIKIIASCHAENIEDLKSKSFFCENMFYRYILLKNARNYGFGRIANVYDERFNIV